MANALYLDSANVFKALSHPLRLRLVNYISFSARTVEECAEKFGQSVQNISKHLKLLRDLKLVEVSKIKNFHYYILSNDQVTQLMSSLAQVTNNYSVSENERWNGSIEEASKLIKSGERLIYDLREVEERNHLPVPSKYLASDFKKPVFLVCRGPWCEKLSFELKKNKNKNKEVLALPYTAHELKILTELLGG